MRVEFDGMGFIGVIRRAKECAEWLCCVSVLVACNQSAQQPSPGPAGSAAQVVQAETADPTDEKDVDVLAARTFSRLKSQDPIDQTATFTIDPGVVHGPFTLFVTNGSPSGEHRASSARVMLNGRAIFRPNDFNQNVASLEAQVDIQATNTLDVSLASAPGSYLIIRISGKVTNTASLVGVTAAAPTLIFQNTPTQVTVTSVIVDPRVQPSSVVLQRVAPDGTASVVGTLHDDGLDGDASFGDRIFTIVSTLNEAVADQVQLRVSATFDGVARPSVSEPVDLFVRPNTTPESMLSQLASELRAGDIDAAVVHFSPSPRHRRLLTSLSSSQLGQLADAFGHAHQISARGNTRVYGVPWHDDDGTAVSLEILLIDDQAGVWSIISW